MYISACHYVTSKHLFEYHLSMSQQSTYVLEWYDRVRMGLPSRCEWGCAL